MGAYYNEIDPEKAEWIRQLIIADVVAPGDVDERSILDVRPDDLRGYTQCHFFAGIGVWSYALRLAGWEDDRPCWTGSCPCPSFSCAGKGAGFDDPRHLWPELFRLQRESRPPVLFGEQSADAIGHGWWDLVSTDLESEAYAVAAAVLTSAGVGATDIRHRLYFVGERMDDSECSRLEGRDRPDDVELHRRARPVRPTSAPSSSLRLAHSDDQQQCDRRDSGAEEESRLQGRTDADGCGVVSGLADTEAVGRGEGWMSERGDREDAAERRHDRESAEQLRPVSKHPFADALNGFWRTADWLFCTDGRWRPVEAGTFPLGHGAPARLGRLRGYGDAINAEVAKAFIQSYTEVERVRQDEEILREI